MRAAAKNNTLTIGVSVVEKVRRGRGQDTLEYFFEHSMNTAP